jgi:hypothetical protein
VLTARPVPVLAPDVQPVVDALAGLAATRLASQIGPELAVGYVEERLDRLAGIPQADVVTIPEDPPS